MNKHHHQVAQAEPIFNSIQIEEIELFERVINQAADDLDLPELHGPTVVSIAMIQLGHAHRPQSDHSAALELTLMALLLQALLDRFSSGWFLVGKKADQATSKCLQFMKTKIDEALHYFGGKGEVPNDLH